MTDLVRGAVARAITLAYAGRSELVAAEGESRLRLALDAGRGPVGVRGRVRDAGLLRDALMTAIAVLESDLRYKGRDRAAYLAYLIKQGKRANAQIWEAHKAFIDRAFADDVRESAGLDPVLTVDPDGVSFEVFSRDESAYARLSLANELFEGREAAHGTSFVDLSKTFVERLDRLRGFAPLEFEAGTALPSRAPGSTRSLEVPAAWLRGFLQVQAAATLPAAACSIAPVDLYNVLFALRSRKAKTSPRALRFELIPGAAPRLVLEPWGLVLETHGEPYRGPAPRVVRTFGRQRLLALARVLPYVRGVRVRLVGPGLPVFLVLDLGPATLTVAFTGWSDASWASAASFDALTPREGAGAGADRASKLLDERGPSSLDEVASTLRVTADEARAALQLACLRGRVVYDLATGAYRPRHLLTTSVNEAEIRYASPREARALRLLGDGGETPSGQVTLTKVHDKAGEGVEVSGTVDDNEARRSYAPRFTVDAEGRVGEAACSCPSFQRAGLREGPCEHMIALRVAYARKRASDEAARQTPEGRKLIRAETRTYVRRSGAGEVRVRVSLDEKVVALRWGPMPGEEKHQRLWFDSDGEAREAYFSRLERLAGEGYVDLDTSAV